MQGMEHFMKSVQRNLGKHSEMFSARYGQQVKGLLELPIKVIFSPITFAFDIGGAASRGFGIPELASHLSFSAIFVVLTLGTYDIALELGKKVLCPRNCHTCNGWKALRCTMCKGTGKAHYRVSNYMLKSGEKATAECVAQAVAENRAELVHFPSSINVLSSLPTKVCPTCDGSGVMGCPDCKHRFPLTISVDDIMEPPWKAYNVLRKMDYPYEHIVDSMKDPKIAAFWLFTLPQVVGGFNYDDEMKQKIWWSYKESMRYDQLRDVVGKRKPGWEVLQSALISLNPERARDDPVIVKNIPYYKARKALEGEVMKLNVPPRPDNWGDLDLPLSASSWTEEELRDPDKLLEAISLLTAQRKMADGILDAQWEAKWRQDKFEQLLEEKLQPYAQNMSTEILPKTIASPSPDSAKQKKSRGRRWWIF
ncbi:hypothetical protein HPP92_003279 [Vanilla planifolia]|uniref:AtTam37 zinc finger domain-containing protein n=1 Tax=Vanilla planifolia TaxID=51239 RepID=A0A835SG61_VANPL|nr:hypothetical protein HPP92_003615 [Vanilla planifolia]KAG0503207.1 hypothetical protein HPP92_003279 [Vanilla planifolia]